MQVFATEQLLANHVKVADRFGSRLRGLMFRAQLETGEGLLIKPCNSVHTCFMRFPIDVLYLDAEGRVLRIAEALAPWRFGPLVRGACQVLELPAGGAWGVKVGECVTMRAQ